MRCVPITEEQAIKIAGSKKKLLELFTATPGQALEGQYLVTFAKLYRNPHTSAWHIFSYAWDDSDAARIIVEVDRGGRCFLYGQKPLIIGGSLRAGV